MKLRIHGNSLRLRLDSSEVAQLQEIGVCTDSLRFAPGSQLTYTLETSSQVTAMDAQYRQDRIRILLPIELAREWAESDRVSLSLQRTEGGPSILIEKDFPCAHRQPGAGKDEAEIPINRA